MVDGISMTPTGGSGDVKSGKKDVKQNSNNSVFSSYDENKDGSVTANEMGIKKTLNNILKNLEKFATSDKFANVLRNIKNIATNLLKDISYNPNATDGLDAVTNEVENRKADVDKLKTIAYDISSNKDEDAVADKFARLELTSEAAKEKVGKEHNARAQMLLALDKATDIAMKNAGNVKISDVDIETMAGLEITDLNVSSKDRLATGTGNDERKEDGIQRGVDGIVVTLTYKYDGVESVIEKVVDSVPEGYVPPKNEDHFDERSTTVTFGTKLQKEFD